MLTVWGRRNSFNVQKVLWLVAELDLPHHHIPAGGTFGLNDTPEFLAMNPHGRVPVIDDDGLVLWESHAILRYLAARSGGEDWWPADPRARAPGDAWMDWCATALHPALINEVFITFFRTVAEKRNAARVAAGIAQCSALFSLLDRQLADRPYVLGESLSLADIAVGTSLYRYFTMEIARPDLPHVSAYYARLQARPAYATHVMVPFADLYGTLKG